MLITLIILLLIVYGAGSAILEHVTTKYVDDVDFLFMLCLWHFTWVCSAVYIASVYWPD